jgi:hypothetical protein
MSIWSPPDLTQAHDSEFRRYKKKTTPGRNKNVRARVCITIGVFDCGDGRRTGAVSWSHN